MPAQGYSVAIGKGGLGGTAAYWARAGGDNVQGEAQKKLDVISNEIFLEANRWGGHLAGMASEEMELPHAIPNRYPQGEYRCSSTRSTARRTSTSTFRLETISRSSVAPRVPIRPGKAFLQPGTQQLAAGCVVYGPTTLLVLTVGDGVACVYARRELGSFVLTQEHMQIPADTRIRHQHVEHAPLGSPVRRYVEEMLAGAGPRSEDFNMRWVASMVADVHPS